MGLDVTLGAAFIAGLLSFLSPCILPLVPPFLCYMAGVSVTDVSGDRPDLRSRILVSVLPFVAGFSLVFVALSSATSILARFISAHLSMLGMVAGVLIIVMACISQCLQNSRCSIGPPPSGRESASRWARHLRMGLAFAFGWTPCAGQILAAVLMMAGSEDTVGRGALLGLFGRDRRSLRDRGRLHRSFRYGAWPRAPAPRRGREDHGRVSGSHRADIPDGPLARRL